MGGGWAGRPARSQPAASRPARPGPPLPPGGVGRYTNPTYPTLYPTSVTSSLPPPPGPRRCMRLARSWTGFIRSLHRPRFPITSRLGPVRIHPLHRSRRPLFKARYAKTRHFPVWLLLLFREASFSPHQSVLLACCDVAQLPVIPPRDIPPTPRD